MGSDRSTTSILKNLEDTLATMRLALEDLLNTASGERRIAALRNLVVFGRAVTNVAQNLKSTESEFEAWYAPWVDEMERDVLLRYFYKLRSTILKEGSVPGRSRTLNRFSTSDLARVGPVPPGATSFFVGDLTGGSGWIVPQSDGKELRYYVSLPVDIEVKTFLDGSPRTHLGKALPDPTMESQCRAYYAYLERFVNEAVRRFTTSSEAE